MEDAIIMKEKEEESGNELDVRCITEYHLNVEKPSKICNDVVIIIDEYLLPSSRMEESTFFYDNM